MTLSRAQLRGWIKMVSGFMSLLDALDRQLRNEAGISHDDYVILSRLHREGSPMRMSDLARETWSSPSRLTHAVGRLEEEDWVTRSRNGIDRRVVEIVLTDAGSAKVHEASSGHLTLVQELVFENLGSERARTTAEAMDQVRRLAEARP